MTEYGVVSVTVSPSPPTPDEAFSLLAARERRLVCAVVRDDGATRERDLARRVVARRRDASPDDVPEERVDSVHSALWHVHLPRLDEAALVDHDRDAHRVAPGPALESVAPLLAYAERHAVDGETTV